MKTWEQWFEQIKDTNEAYAIMKTKEWFELLKHQTFERMKESRFKPTEEIKNKESEP